MATRRQQLTDMAAFYSIYWGYIRTALVVQFQYRIAMLIWLLGGIIEPLMYLVVWRTVAAAAGRDWWAATPSTTLSSTTSP